VKSTLRNNRGIALDPIDQTMLAGDTSRPIPGPLVAQRLGLGDPGEGLFENFLQLPLELGQDAAIAFRQCTRSFSACEVQKTLLGRFSSASAKLRLDLGVRGA